MCDNQDQLNWQNSRKVSIIFFRDQTLLLIYGDSCLLLAVKDAYDELEIPILWQFWSIQIEKYIIINMPRRDADLTTPI